MRLPTNDVLDALHGKVVRRERLPATISVSTDSRAIRPGDTFLALHGERFDGHDYVRGAVADGAVAAIVERSGVVPDGAAAIVVPDALGAYIALGALARTRLRGPVVAITGSTGKTTTKTFLRQVLEATNRGVVTTPENENNEIGVAKFLLACEDGDTRAAVIEMGARKYHDLVPLVAAALPDVGILTNVGDAHLEIMGSRAQLAETKWELFATGARAVLNLADAVSRERCTTLAAAPVWFGIDDERPPDGQPAAVVRINDVIVVNGSDVEAVPWPIDVRGAHNRRNLAAALAAAWLLGIEPATIAHASPELALPAGRYERIDTPNGPTIVYDAYNASMSGALATLATFATEATAGRKIVVLGSMAELGDEAPEMHERVGAAAAAAADVVLTGGAFADALARGARAAGMAAGAVIAYANNDDAVAWLREHGAPGDLVLLKGSRMYQMEQIVAGLRA
jgi:UDP-N-acetylmuramoyl-tripeptide--D-alanyl-D-alanine ligase